MPPFPYHELEDFPFSFFFLLSRYVDLDSPFFVERVSPARKEGQRPLTN